ncbi:MAG: multiheme c-type cytochrome, partial [Thermoguttaceae bacterium]
MPTLKAGWTCLFVLLSLVAGCWDSHPKQEAGDQAAAKGSGAPASDYQPSQKMAESSSVEKGATAGPPDELGFEHTLKPNSTPPIKTLADTPGIVAHPRDEDDRYAELAPVPAVGKQVGAPQTPAMGNPSAGSVRSMEPANSQPAGPVPRVVPEAASILPTTVEPAKREPAKPDARTSNSPPVGNPLRDSDAAPLTNRPEAPPQPTAPSEPVIVVPVKPTPPAVVPPQAAQKSELVIQVKPGETITAQPPVSATPVAPVAEKKPEPKERSAEPAKTGPRTNKNSGVPFDPIKENGPIFVDWPKPKLALVITGNQEGYLEPCGCAGLDRMKGGMSRRYSLFDQLRTKGWPTIGIDVGGIAKGFGKQAELKFQIAINAMSEMRYNVATLGLSDLHLPTAEVMALTMPANAKKKSMFVCGNVGLFVFDETLLPRTQLLTTGFKTVGVTAVLGKSYMAQLAGNTDLKTMDPEKLLDQAVPLLKTRANYLILLAQTTHKEAIDLAHKYPDFDLVICSDGNAEPPKDFEEIRKGGTKLIEVGEKGMYAIVLGMFDDPRQPLLYQRVTLDSRFRASPEMSELMSAYQGQLKDLGLSGLGIRPLPHPLKPFNGDFVGTDACKNCHEESYRVWKKSPHSRAFATLQNVNPPRNFDPECISCHTVGWHPTKFFPYQSGYLSEKETPKLINVGCENCHGPGQMHVWAENHGTKAEQLTARKAVVITKEEAANPNSPKENCWSCHDLD